MAEHAVPPEIGILVYPGAQLGVVHGLSDVLGIAEGLARGHRGVDGPTLRVTHWQLDETARVVCVRDTAPGPLPSPGFVLVPLTMADWPSAGAQDSISAWLRERHAGGSGLGSVCSGALVLAETGLLNGRLASTHWAYEEEFKARFPAVRVNSRIRMVDYGDIVTVGGFMAWIDMGLRLISRFLGPTVADETARFLLIRPGSWNAPYFQAFVPNLVHGDEAVLRAQQYIHERDGRGVVLAGIAEAAQLEDRTLLRRFLKATGMSPIAYTRSVRLSRARELLEYSNRTLKQMAWELGYEDERTLSRAFSKVVGMSPAEYRRRFQQEKGGEDFLDVPGGEGHRGAQPKGDVVMWQMDRSAPLPSVQETRRLSPASNAPREGVVVSDARSLGSAGSDPER